MCAPTQCATTTRLSALVGARATHETPTSTHTVCPPRGARRGCADLKLLSASEELSADGFKADTPYTIMFGPDKCGETNKVHFILRHKNPVSLVWEEKHLVTPPIPDTTDKMTHLYTAIVGTDNTVKILVDNVEKKSVSLLSATDFKPPVNPEKQIDDPEDKKPDDWVDEPKMDEPGAKKPEDCTRAAANRAHAPRPAQAPCASTRPAHAHARRPARGKRS